MKKFANTLKEWHSRFSEGASSPEGKLDGLLSSIDDPSLEAMVKTAFEKLNESLPEWKVDVDDGAVGLKRKEQVGNFTVLSELYFQNDHLWASTELLEGAYLADETELHHLEYDAPTFMAEIGTIVEKLQTEFEEFSLISQDHAAAIDERREVQALEEKEKKMEGMGNWLHESPEELARLKRIAYDDPDDDEAWDRYEALKRRMGIPDVPDEGGLAGAAQGLPKGQASQVDDLDWEEEEFDGYGGVGNPEVEMPDWEEGDDLWEMYGGFDGMSHLSRRGQERETKPFGMDYKSMDIDTLLHRSYSGDMEAEAEITRRQEKKARPRRGFEESRTNLLVPGSKLLSIFSRLIWKHPDRVPEFADQYLEGESKRMALDAARCREKGDVNGAKECLSRFASSLGVEQPTLDESPDPERLKRLASAGDDRASRELDRHKHRQGGNLSDPVLKACQSLADEMKQIGGVQVSAAILDDGKFYGSFKSDNCHGNWRAVISPFRDESNVEAFGLFCEDERPYSKFWSVSFEDFMNWSEYTINKLKSDEEKMKKTIDESPGDPERLKRLASVGDDRASQELDRHNTRQGEPSFPQYEEPDLPSVEEISDFLHVDQAEAHVIQDTMRTMSGWRAMQRINGIMGAYGVESISNSDYGEPEVSYINTGDTYNGTVIHDESDDSFHVTTLGDWMESQQGGLTEAEGPEAARQLDQFASHDEGLDRGKEIAGLISKKLPRPQVYDAGMGRYEIQADIGQDGYIFVETSAESVAVSAHTSRGSEIFSQTVPWDYSEGIRGWFEWIMMTVEDAASELEAYYGR